MASRYLKPFIYSAGGILLAAALMRFIIAAGDAPVLSLPEPMLGIPVRAGVLTVGILQLMVALICLFGKQTTLQVGWLAWLATNYVVFRIGLLWTGTHIQATCIGSLTDPLYLSRGIIGILGNLLVIYLLLGAYGAVLSLWRDGSRSTSERWIKMSCPDCAVHIRFDRRNIGQNIGCPHCQKTIILRKPENLKMSCFFCKEHIEFPAYALGEKLPCPHCKMDITLKEPA